MAHYKVGSLEYEALMAKWSKEAAAEEAQRDYESWLENEDAHGRLPPTAAVVAQ